MAGLGETIRENAGALLATLQKDPLTTLVGQKIGNASNDLPSQTLKISSLPLEYDTRLLLDLGTLVLRRINLPLWRPGGLLNLLRISRSIRKPRDVLHRSIPEAVYCRGHHLLDAHRCTVTSILGMILLSADIHSEV